MFSTVADIMGEVVLRIHPSVNAAYVDRKDEIGVTVKSVYDKLKGIETPVSRALVRNTAERMQAIIKQMGGMAKPMLAGYRTRIVDGNHLRRTDRRIGELRKLNEALLPGKSLVVYDPQYRLAIDVREERFSSGIRPRINESTSFTAMPIWLIAPPSTRIIWRQVEKMAR